MQLDFGLPLKVRKSKKRTKTLSIRITTDAICVITPQHVSDSALHDTLLQKAAWIQKRVDEVLLQEEQRKDLQHRGIVLYLGKEHQLQVIHGEGKPTVELVEKNIVVRGKVNDAEMALKKWYKSQAYTIIEPLAQTYADMLGESFDKIRIKNLRSRWGSCSSNKNLNFSVSLVLAPYEIIKYVVIHEVCHLRHHNHKKVFWDEVAQLDPDYKSKRAWLKKHGWQLRI